MLGQQDVTVWSKATCEPLTPHTPTRIQHRGTSLTSSEFHKHRSTSPKLYTEVNLKALLTVKTCASEEEVSRARHAGVCQEVEKPSFAPSSFVSAPYSFPAVSP